MSAELTLFNKLIEYTYGMKAQKQTLSFDVVNWNIFQLECELLTQTTLAAVAATTTTQM